MAMITIDKKGLSDFASLLFSLSPGVHEVRVLDAITNDYAKPHVENGYFDCADKIVVALDRIAKAKGVFITINPCRQSLLARRVNRLGVCKSGESTSDGDITKLNWIPIDIDPVRPSGISSTNEEWGIAHDRMKIVIDFMVNKYGFCAPIVADSGNGAHALFHVDLAMGESSIVSRLLKILDSKFSDDKAKIDTTVYNPARIWKLYGTMACKGDSTADRPHRMSRILEAPPCAQ